MNSNTRQGVYFGKQPEELQLALRNIRRSSQTTNLFKSIHQNFWEQVNILGIRPTNCFRFMPSLTRRWVLDRTSETNLPPVIYSDGFTKGYPRIRTEDVTALRAKMCKREGDSQHQDEKYYGIWVATQYYPTYAIQRIQEELLWFRTVSISIIRSANTHLLIGTDDIAYILDCLLDHFKKNYEPGAFFPAYHGTIVGNFQAPYNIQDLKERYDPPITIQFRVSPTSEEKLRMAVNPHHSGGNADEDQYWALLRNGMGLEDLFPYLSLPQPGLRRSGAVRSPPRRIMELPSIMGNSDTSEGTSQQHDRFSWQRDSLQDGNDAFPSAADYDNRQNYTGFVQQQAHGYSGGEERESGVFGDQRYHGLILGRRTEPSWETTPTGNEYNNPNRSNPRSSTDLDQRHLPSANTRPFLRDTRHPVVIQQLPHHIFPSAGAVSDLGDSDYVAGDPTNVSPISDEDGFYYN